VTFETGQGDGAAERRFLPFYIAFTADVRYHMHWVSKSPIQEECLMRYTGEERRRYPRSRRGFPLVVDDKGPGVLNHVDSISASGVLCHTVKPIPLETKMSIVLELPKPHERRVKCEGIVVRCEPHDKGDDHFKVAILYTKMEPEDLEAISDFVEHDLAQPLPED